MLTNHHTTAGTITFIGLTTLTGSSLVGGVGAICSHFLLDLVGEKYNVKTMLILEIIFHSLFLYLGYSLNMFWIFVLGAVLGNLPDVIDKKCYLSFYDLKKYPYTFYLHFVPLLFSLTKRQTTIVTIINIITILILCID